MPEQLRVRAMRVMGHECSELADITGGYLCKCENASWLHTLKGYPPGGACPEGWEAAGKLIDAGYLTDPSEQTYEWGYSVPDGADTHFLERSEAEARRIVKGSLPGARTLARRIAPGPWESVTEDSDG